MAHPLDTLGLVRDRQVVQQRRAVIARALAHIATTDNATVVAQLLAADIRLHDHLRRDPLALIQTLHDGMYAADAHFVAAYFGARQVLQAAGQPTA
ncbi:MULTISPECIES: hypothetical protein [unclassified Nocardia]|uniref:hypothetical protein n=1 Tax=unclassified Nocardia TaxID=2637762 RepID=UPI00278C0D16|nr:MULTISPECIES: hypothetical protein [unclassified Nocardia]